jgi:hypothetical protein
MMKILCIPLLLHFHLPNAIRFIYSGDLCFEDFEEACTILKLATSLELAGANDAAREYIFNYMFPYRLWQAFQCAKEADDKELLSTVMEVRKNVKLLQLEYTFNNIFVFARKVR